MLEESTLCNRLWQTGSLILLNLADLINHSNYPRKIFLQADPNIFHLPTLTDTRLESADPFLMCWVFCRSRDILQSRSQNYHKSAATKFINHYYTSGVIIWMNIFIKIILMFASFTFYQVKTLMKICTLIFHVNF